MPHPEFVEPLKEIVLEAGKIIMDFYDNGADVSTKEDKSPVTEADIAANEYIVNKLKELAPNIPIVAEESKNDDEFGQASEFWLVDPVDGTKSFIKRTGEFTVNIGLIKDGRPQMGVIYVPVKDILYYTTADGKAYRKIGDGADEQIQARTPPEEGMVVVASVSHRTQETEDFINNLPRVDKIISASSSLKLCLVAEGQADVYPRFGPTCEWDIAAGHAILSAAGGRLTTEGGENFAYGKPKYLNGYFIAWGG
jgi:3'(2'), 5'-bisphosphate nucleotidase